MNDVDIKLIGDEELMRVLYNLEYKTQHKVLKKIVRDAGQKTMVRELKQRTPVGPTGNLKRSMGIVQGRSKRSAVAFAGPRMSSTYKGYIANILEHSKGQRRYPKSTKALMTPWGPRKSVGPLRRQVFVRPSLISQLRPAELHIIKSLRTIMEREMRKARKTGIV